MFDSVLVKFEAFGKAAGTIKIGKKEQPVIIASES